MNRIMYKLANYWGYSTEDWDVIKDVPAGRKARWEMITTLLSMIGVFVGTFSLFRLMDYNHLVSLVAATLIALALGLFDAQFFYENRFGQTSRASIRLRCVIVMGLLIASGFVSVVNYFSADIDRVIAADIDKSVLSFESSNDVLATQLQAVRLQKAKVDSAIAERKKSEDEIFLLSDKILQNKKMMGLEADGGTDADTGLKANAGRATRYKGFYHQAQMQQEQRQLLQNKLAKLEAENALVNRRETLINEEIALKAKIKSLVEQQHKGLNGKLQAFGTVYENNKLSTLISMGIMLFIIMFLELIQMSSLLSSINNRYVEDEMIRKLMAHKVSQQLQKPYLNLPQHKTVLLVDAPKLKQPELKVVGDES